MSLLGYWRRLRSWLRDRLAANAPTGSRAGQDDPDARLHDVAGEASAGLRDPSGRGAVGASGRSPLRFVALVFLLSVPFWVTGLVTRGKLSADLPISALMVVCPVAASAILVHRENGSAAVTALLRRSFDFARLTHKRWWLPTLLLGPGVYATTYAIMRGTGMSVPDPQFPLLAVIATTAAFWAAGLGEELGWSGYAIDPLQERLGALRAGVLLGNVWAAWHVTPLVQAGRSAAWIAWWWLGTVAFRVLLTWVYNNTGRSVAATALCHALANLVWIGPFLDFGPGGYPEAGERISALILAAAAAIISILWGPRTLTRRLPTGANRQQAIVRRRT